MIHTDCHTLDPIFSPPYISPGPSEAVRHGGGRRTKNLQGEREKRERREERKRKDEKEKREEKKERKGEEIKRERCITPIWV